MAINRNLNSFITQPKGEGRPGSQPKGDKDAAQPSMSFVNIPVSFQPKAAATVAQPLPPKIATVAAPSGQPLETPTFTPGIRPGFIPKLPTTPNIRILPTLPWGFLLKTTTQLARGSIQQLAQTTPGVLREAINTLKNKKITAGGLMNYLERKVIIGEVLNELAKDWSNDTKEDFAAAFQMDSNKSEVMDSLVSIAVLNDPDLEEEIQIENTPETTEGDLLENRRIVWQYPPPGTPLDPPYLVLVAVEHQEVAKAEEIVQSITKELISYQEYKIPKAAAQKLR